MKYILIVFILFISCNNDSKYRNIQEELNYVQVDTLPTNEVKYKIPNNHFALAGLINDTDRALTLVYFNPIDSSGYFLSRNECSSIQNKIDFTFTCTDSIAFIKLKNNDDYHFPNKIQFLNNRFRVLEINTFKHNSEEYSFYSPCSMRGPNENFYNIDLINTLKVDDLITSIDESNFNLLITTDIKSMVFEEKNKNKRNTFLEEYNNNHTCSDQKSFDAGYDMAREQRGVTIDLDLDQYLFKLTKELGLDYNIYCFKKGVQQYISDKTN